MNNQKTIHGNPLREELNVMFELLRAASTCAAALVAEEIFKDRYDTLVRLVTDMNTLHDGMLHILQERENELRKVQ